jgi:hypothetical protein
MVAAAKALLMLPSMQDHCKCLPATVHVRGGDINFSTPSAGTGATYSWTGPNGFSSTSRTTTNGNVGTGDAGDYTVTVTLNGCSSQSTTNVTVNAGPTANATSNSPVCVGGDINLSTPSARTGATYSWTGPNGFSSTSRQPTNGNVGTGDAGNYTVTVTLNGCSSQSTTSVVVNANPPTQLFQLMVPNFFVTVEV